MKPQRRRLGFVLAGAIAALAALIAALPLIQEGYGSGELSGPEIVPRPVVIALLLALPAALAAVAAARGSRPIFIAAGVLCLLQSFVSFGGATFGFLIPAILLIVIGVEGGSTTRTPRRALLAGVLVIGLGFAAWIVPLATGETVCWIARPGPEGKPIYTIIPNTDTLTSGPGDLGSGCGGGTFTLQGLMLGGVLWIGAVAVAGLATGSAPKAEDQDPAVA
ncbi:MAG: hypothetical protein QOD78_1082 [Chloroflexota bacterium]|jgi:hypothetical protein|nr:hypothetical protein [Chloroflexota bacterium]